MTDLGFLYVSVGAVEARAGRAQLALAGA